MKLPFAADTEDHRAEPVLPGRAPDAVMSYRFLLARTYLIVLLLVGLLALFTVSLVAYTLWNRSELANAHYEHLLEDVSRQEYFVEQFQKIAPAYLCATEACLPAALRSALPAPGQFARLMLGPPGQTAPFYLMRAAKPETFGATSARASDSDADTAKATDAAASWNVLSLAARFAQFDTAFWSGVQSGENSVLMAADGNVSVFVPHPRGGPAPDAKTLGLFMRRRLAALHTALGRHARAVPAEVSSAHWAGPVIDPTSGRPIFICFIPIRNAASQTIGYASTDIAPNSLVPRALAHAPPFKGDFLLFSATGLLVQRIGQTVPISAAGKPGMRLQRGDSGRSVTLSLRHAVVRIERIVPGLGWHVVYAVRLSSVLAEKRVAIGVAAALCGLLCLLTGLSARRILLRVIRPAALQAQRLAESEQFNRTIIDTSPVGLAVLAEQDGRLIVQNARFVPLAEWRVAGQPDGSAALALRRHGSAAAQPLAPLHMQSAVRGHHYKVDLARAMHDGHPVLLCALTDVSEQKQVEEALERARRAAEAASASKTTFLATLSHDIRTPLYGMLASIELIAKTALERRQRELVQALDGAAQTLKDGLNDALDFTKIEAGELTLDLAPFNLTDEIERVVRGFCSRAMLHATRLHCFVAPELNGQWLGDTLKIRHILNNLLNNAVKFSQQGEVTVSAALSPARAGEAARISLSVQDTGPGIDERDIQRIFLPFEQADGTQRGQVSGSGLGLSICRRYAHILGGRLDVRSVVGEGSVFTLELALERQAGAQATVARALLQNLCLRIDAPSKIQAYLAAVFAAHGGTVSACPQRLDKAAPNYLAQVAITDTRAPELETALLCIDPSLPFEPQRAPGRILVTSLSQKAIVVAARMAGADALLEEAAASTGAPADVPAARDIAVLVIDDQPINRIVVQQQLQQLGCTVEAAASGTAALASLAERRYALILTDLNMPGMSGYEFARRYRALQGTTPIVAVTAATLAGERERCLRAGMNDYLVKPFSLAALATLLERHARRPSQVKAAAPATQLADPLANPLVDPLPHPSANSSANTTAHTGVNLVADLATSSAALHTLGRMLQKWDGAAIDIVLKSLAQDVADLREALASAQTARLGQVTHRVEGGVAALGIRPALTLCGAIRACIAYDWPLEAFGLVPMLTAMLEQTVADVRTLRQLS